MEILLPNKIKKWYKIKFIILIAIIIIIYLIPLDYIEGRSFCIFYNLTEKNCLGCGFTRAFFNMIRGNFKEAVAYNSMIMVLGPIFIGGYVYEFIHTLNKIKGKKTKKKSILKNIVNVIF